jgi:hypothetical protein
MRSFLRQEHGNALVELAVAIPILILIAVGVADYSRLYFTEITVANAARSGADWGIKANGNVDSMAFGARMEAGRDSVGMIITAGVFCTCPGVAGTADCSGTCGAYGPPRAFDSVAVAKSVRFFIRYVGGPDSVVISRKAILRSN